MVLEQLLLQPLRRIELIQPWRAAGNRPGVVGDSVLAGAMTLHFEHFALVFRSPLRFSACQTGTVIGFRSDGAVQTLGYRFDVMPSEDVGGLFGACEPRLSLTPDKWPGLCHVGKAQSVFLLADFGQHGGANSLRLRLLDRGWCSVIYRRDLDGAIELSPQDERAEVPSIAVLSPDDEFGWLHPASAHPFVLDGQYWRTAHPRDWPWPLAKGLQSQPACDLYQAVMTRALLARFTQHEGLHRRLLAMQKPPLVAGLPDGLIGDVRQQLLKVGRLTAVVS
jgi:hypothetical protein